MRKIKYLTIILSICTFVGAVDPTASTTPADPTVAPATEVPTVVATTSTEPSDPTLAFFVAMATCTPGTYSERNYMGDNIGQVILTQKIMGLSDDKKFCNAILATPDNRVLVCQFPLNSLPQLNDQIYLEGVLEGNTDAPNQNAINSDLLWSRLKEDNCSLTSDGGE